MPDPRWHVVEGEAGCRFAVESGAVAVVVDALRASATAACLLDAGASPLLVVETVEQARAARAAMPGALLFGERGGLPPEGFDRGNSPRDTAGVAGRPVVFTTTTGAGRLVACWGAPAVYMGTTVNASAVVHAALRHERDVVVIPAGLATDPAFDAQEDWAAAAFLAGRSGQLLGEGAGRCRAWLARIDADGLPALFDAAPHAGKLRRVGLGDDVAYCARVDVCRAVPKGVERNAFGVVCADGGG